MRSGLIGLAVLGMAAGCLISPMPARAQISPAVSLSSALMIPQVALLQPADVVKLLQGGVRPVIFQVGSHLMFSQAHIPGSVYAGPGSQAAGIDLLVSKVASLPKGTLIVIYCGCCPWNRCPNMGPAYQRLHALGFTNVKAMYVASNFGDDWVNKGYPVEKGE